MFCGPKLMHVVFQETTGATCVLLSCLFCACELHTVKALDVDLKVVVDAVPSSCGASE